MGGPLLDLAQGLCVKEADDVVAERLAQALPLGHSAIQEFDSSGLRKYLPEILWQLLKLHGPVSVFLRRTCLFVPGVRAPLLTQNHFFFY